MTNIAGVTKYEPTMTDAEVLEMCRFGFKTHRDDGEIHARMAPMCHAGLMRATCPPDSQHPSYRTTERGVAMMREGE